MGRQEDDEKRREELRKARAKAEKLQDDKELTPQQAKVRDAVFSAVPTRIVDMVRGALLESGTSWEDADKLAHDVVVCSRPSANQHQEKNKQGLRRVLKPQKPELPRLMTKSEYSRQLLALDRLGFEHALEAGWAKNAEAVLSRFEPDGQDLLFIGDGHEKNYSTPPVPEGVKIDMSRRRGHSIEAHRENRAYDWCTYYLGGILLWKHQGRVHILPVMLSHPWPGIEQSPKMHARLILRVVQGLPRRPSAIVLDSHYDGQEFRDTIHAAGHVCVVRMSVGPNTDRHVTLSNGVDTTVCTLAQEIADDKTLEIREYIEEDMYRTKELTRAKRKIFEVTLGKRGGKSRDQRTVKLLVRVCLKFGPTGASEIDWNRLMVVIMDGPESARPIRFLYHFRFRIENMYQQLVLSETTGREQCINTEHIQFMVSLFLLGTALMVLYVMMAYAEDGFFGPLRVSVLSARAVTEVLLEDL